jgi:16S rRNA (adenine1518-N6/adenine1519-N6)-dimethyltransferase
MEPRPADPVLAAVDARRLGALVTVAFSQRRKLLRHTLGRWIDAERLATDFDLQRRAEEVPVAEYLALARLPRGA